MCRSAGRPVLPDHSRTRLNISGKRRSQGPCSWSDYRLPLKIKYVDLLALENVSERLQAF